MQRDCPWTKRQRSVIHLLSLGMTAKEIARETASTQASVQHHINQARVKASIQLGRSITALGAVTMAIRNGWID